MPDQKPWKSVGLALWGVGLAVSISLAQTMTLVFVVMAVISSRRVSSPPRWTWRPLDIPLLTLIGWGWWTTWLSHSLSVGRAISYFSALLLYFWAAHGDHEEQIKKILKWFLMASIFMGILGICQYAGGISGYVNDEPLIIPPFFTGWPLWLVDALAQHNFRSVGTRSHPLTYAEVLAPALMMFLALFVQTTEERPLHKKRLLGLGAALISIGGGLFFSQSRAVWLSLVVIVPLFVAFMDSRQRWKAFVVVGLAGIVALAVMPDSLRGRFFSIVSSHQGNVHDQESKSERMGIWRESLKAIRRAPVAGVGLKGVRLETPKSGKPHVWSETHNIFLQWGAEMGLVGLGIFMWILCVIARLCWNHPLRGVAIPIFIGFMIMGLTESWIRDKEVAMLFWFLAGLMSRPPVDEARLRR